MNSTPVEINQRYGHADACMFGTKNSGMCDCGRGFDEAPYKFPDRPAQKSSTSILVSTPGNVACPTCGCRDRQKYSCELRGGCKCHRC